MYLNLYRVERISAMKYLFVSFFGFLFFGSCSTYYCSTMNTKDSYTVKNDYGEFVIEGDSLDVIYNFYGQNAPIMVGVLNKTSKPLYIDWSKSGIMIDNEPITYKESQNKAKDGGSPFINFGYFLDNSNDLSFVKPYSRLNKQILELTNFNFQKINDSLYHNWNTEADSWGKNKKYKTIRYVESDSPIYLRTFLTVYEDSRSADEAFFYENDFYMSELIKMKGTSPESIAAYRYSRGDFFYVEDVKEKKPQKVKKDSPSVFSKVATVTGRIMVWAVEGADRNSDQ